MQERNFINIKSDCRTLELLEQDLQDGKICWEPPWRCVRPHGEKISGCVSTRRCSRVPCMPPPISLASQQRLHACGAHLMPGDVFALKSSDWCVPRALHVFVFLFLFCFVVIYHCGAAASPCFLPLVVPLSHSHTHPLSSRARVPTRWVVIRHAHSAA